MFYIDNISCVLATSVEYVCVTNNKKLLMFWPSNPEDYEAFSRYLNCFHVVIVICRLHYFAALLLVLANKNASIE